MLSMPHDSCPAVQSFFGVSAKIHVCSTAGCPSRQHCTSDSFLLFHSCMILVVGCNEVLQIFGKVAAVSICSTMQESAGFHDWYIPEGTLCVSHADNLSCSYTWSLSTVKLWLTAAALYICLQDAPSSPWISFHPNPNALCASYCGAKSRHWLRLLQYTIMHSHQKVPRG